jgi:hypothetical protein
MADAIDYRRRLEYCLIQAEHSKSPEFRELWLCLKDSYAVLLELEAAERRFFGYRADGTSATRALLRPRFA